MKSCFFVSDLHGKGHRYEALFAAVERDRPAGVFLGGDLLPWWGHSVNGTIADDFVSDFLIAGFTRLRDTMGVDYPEVFIILGNDDVRAEEPKLQAADQNGIWHYQHRRTTPFDRYSVTGYSFVPPTPFQLKDWERYDVSRFVDPGCISPEAGKRSVEVRDRDNKYRTIAADLKDLATDKDLSNHIFLFHTPPYQTKLDRAALDGKMVDHAPLDVHVGSIAVRKFIEKRQPLLTLHGHVHESARLTGAWMDRIGDTVCLSAAHDGPELALVRFDPAAPGEAIRELL